MRIKTQPVWAAGVTLFVVASIAPVATTTADLRLAEAARRGDTEAVRTLLGEGVPVDTQPDGVTAPRRSARSPGGTGSAEGISCMRRQT